MKSYAIRMRPLGPWTTPWHADRLSGPRSARLKALPHPNLDRKPPEWVPEATFRTLLRENSTLPPQAEWRQPIVSSRRLHASIERTTGTTAGGGQLFEIPEWRVRTEDGQGGNGNLILYFRCAQDPDSLCSLLRSLGASGFGKKHTSGHGAF